MLTSIIPSFDLYIYIYIYYVCVWGGGGEGGGVCVYSWVFWGFFKHCLLYVSDVN